MLKGIPVQGIAKITNTQTTTAILAASTDYQYYIKSIAVTIEKFADTAVLTVGDGTIIPVDILMKDGNGSAFSFTFPGDGLQMTTSAAVSMTIGTANATATVVIIGYKRTAT